MEDLTIRLGGSYLGKHMKRQREADYEIVVRLTQLDRMAAFLDRGTMQSQEMLDACSVDDRTAMLTFIRRWRNSAIINFIGFTLSYELHYLLLDERIEAEPERV